MLVANCEIYNWRELADEHGFEPKNDADLLLKILQEKGIDALKEVDGVYAFAYVSYGEVVVARDVLGVKPVWYSEEPFAFASEKQALEDQGFEARELHPRKILRYNIEEESITFEDRQFFEIDVEEGVEVDEENEELVLESGRKNPDELVEIRFESLELLTLSRLVDKSDLKIRGHEVDIHDAVESDPSIIEDGLKVVERERETPAGFIDVFGRDEEDNYVVVEVKRNPDYNTVLQLQRYVEEIEDEFAGKLRGILLAPKMTDKVLDYLEERGLEFVEVEMEDVIASYDGFDNSQKGLEDFSAVYDA